LSSTTFTNTCRLSQIPHSDYTHLSDITHAKFHELSIDQHALDSVTSDEESIRYISYRKESVFTYTKISKSHEKHRNNGIFDGVFETSSESSGDTLSESSVSNDRNYI
jgi:hypothetical protein